MNKISIKGVSKKFQNNEIFKDLTLEIYPGITAIMGPSGSGKSTLLKCICELETLDEGQIELFNKRVGIVFQQFHLWKHLNALENCLLAPMKVLKIKRKEAYEKALFWFKKLGIENKQYDYPAKLSGGEQQRVAIVRALMMEPEVLLFDEPTSALDPERTQSVLEIIKLLKGEKIIIVVTHDIQFANEVADVILSLNEGKLINTLSKINYSTSNDYSTVNEKTEILNYG